MKKILIVLVCALAVAQLSAQDSGGGGGNPGGGGGGNENLSDKRSVIAVQAFKMGIMAVDYERMLGSRLGLQGTVGLFGVEGAIKVHTKQSITSSSFSLALGWQPRNLLFEAVVLDIEGGDEYLSSFPKLSFNYEYRAQRLFTFSTGLGMQRMNYVVSADRTYSSTYNLWGAFFRVGVGVYFAL